ncbi:MAG: prolyl oligopeptidase family serine peptidase [Alphaproteobacteria bacterium]|nr:prolyl oligopeptidase family serine peptidase [Alphaproteobacteria bacterium]
MRSGLARSCGACVLALALGFAAVGRAEVQERSIASPALGRDLPHVVYTPPPETVRGRTPALVLLLHGTVSRGGDWITMAKAAETLDRLIAAGRLRPVVALMPDAGNSWYVDSAALGGPGDYQRAILDDLLPAIEKQWRTDPRREARAVAGISMGGFGALRFAFARPELFVAAASMSGAFWTRSDQRTRPPEIVARIFQGAFGTPFDRDRFVALSPLGEAARLDPARAPAVMFIAGREDRFRTLEESRDLAARFAERGIASDIAEVPGDHDWGTWERSLEPVLLFIERAFAAAR